MGDNEKVGLKLGGKYEYGLGEKLDIGFEPFPKLKFPEHINTPGFVFPLEYPKLSFKLKLPIFERSPSYEMIRNFINKRAGSEILPKVNATEDGYIIGLSAKFSGGLAYGKDNVRRPDTVISAEVLRGPHNDGEIKIRVITSSNQNIFEKKFDVKYYIVRTDGKIFTEDESESRELISSISKEDASGLIAAIYGKEELDNAQAPSNAHIDGVKRLLGMGTDTENIFNFGPIYRQPFQMKPIIETPYYKILPYIDGNGGGIKIEPKF